MLKLVKNDIVGAIDHYNGEFINIPTPVDIFYSHLLPTNYSKSKSNSLVYRSDIYIICRGVLFVFNLKSNNFKPLPSVRAVPKYDGSRPYQQLVFQYSLHVQETLTSELKHREYLADPSQDPRIGFIEQLIQDCGNSGDIIVYNIGFEKGKLNDLIDGIP